ncbi:HypC/HybG/HupF family hydrogenase formation chaperone [Acetobacter fabarum]|jgi:hydrogenase expression/formation protein HypC|uniref:HypC/HybG/HupF family hydrogenase formation chaperone n=1 Tax=Acetobacter fabarum TaxID=483199 RepID=UPI0033B9D641|nr:HypC/HybG/HupF family hydrogenase formation chaperone [Acetobacter fabarum]
MCLGIPMKVLRCKGSFALCVAEPTPGQQQSARQEQVDTILVPHVQEGDYVLVFMGMARARMEPDEARKLQDALQALATLAAAPVDAGAAQQIVTHGFADLCNAPPRLPPHLQAAFDAGLTEA